MNILFLGRIQDKEILDGLIELAAQHHILVLETGKKTITRINTDQADVLVLVGVGKNNWWEAITKQITDIPILYYSTFGKPDYIGDNMVILYSELMFAASIAYLLKK